MIGDDHTLAVVGADRTIEADALEGADETLPESSNAPP